ncbi:hypothetical protein J4Q44_G00126030, partial [Coregonus suidteri]
MPAVELECPPPNAICSVCRVLEEAELWCCGDCGSDKYFCATCAVRTHSTPNIGHQLELWKVLYFMLCQLTCQLLANKNCFPVKNVDHVHYRSKVWVHLEISLFS